MSEVASHGYTAPEAHERGWVDRIAGMPLVKFRTYFEGGGVDVDIFLAEKPFQREALSRRVVVETEVGPVWLVTPEDLILFKLVAARPRDMIDVADMLFVLGELDEAYMKRWAARLGVLDLLVEKLSNRPTERP